MKTITRVDYLSYVDSKNQKRLLLSAIKHIIRAQLTVKIPTKTDALFIKSLIRNDYNLFFDRVYEQWPGVKAKTDITYKNDNPYLYVRLLKILFYLPLFFQVYEKGFRVSIYRYLRAIIYLGVLKQFRNCQINTLVAFADMQGVENMLVQYFKNRGARTITLQHGLYVDYSSFENINKVNYESVVSDYFLAWGDETRELIEKYHPEVKVVICGKPIFFTPRQEIKDYFTMVFDQNIFEDQNKELLAIAYAIAAETGLKLNVRLHPWNKKETYTFDEEETLFGEDLGFSSFIIGHTTSMIFECIRNGIPAYKYHTEIPANIISEELKFSNAEELLMKLKSMDKFNFTEAGKYYLKYVGDESLEQYKNFFDVLNANH